MTAGHEATKVWTAGRKWAGNLFPLLFWLPLILAGLWVTIRDRAVTPLGVGLAVAGTAAGWFALCLFGLWGNTKMRRLLDARIKDKGDRWFVGFASPKFTSLLDAHEDVGFLILGKDGLTFAGDSMRVELSKDKIVRVRFKANAHTVVGLGRFVCVEGIVSGQPVRMLLEPRERWTMFGNLLLSSKLKREIEIWMQKA